MVDVFLCQVLERAASCLQSGVIARQNSAADSTASGADSTASGSEEEFDCYDYDMEDPDVEVEVEKNRE